MKSCFRFLFALTVAFGFVLPVGHARAATRSSLSYAITTESLDAGGTRLSSAAYAVNAGTGAVGALSSVASPAITDKGGYIGQLYEVQGFMISASPASVNEGATRQLNPSNVLDDTSLLAVDPTTVAWSVDSGPLASVSSSGLATAAIVYQDTGAVARGIFGAFNGTVNLLVVNTNKDNFGAYAGDGIDDAWQVQYFGQPPNALAGPNADPDGDGRTNLQEFVEGTVPTDPASRFQLRIAPVAGQSGQKALSFSPRLLDRNYTLESRVSLTTGNWAILTGLSDPVDVGSERTVIDLNATGAAKFYRLKIDLLTP
jgi:hypothetical protein